MKKNKKYAECFCGEEYERRCYATDPLLDACKTCLFLDGICSVSRKPRSSAFEIVSTLRILGRCNWRALELEMHWLNSRTLFRNLKQLVDVGRVKKFEVEAFSNLAREMETEYELAGILR